MGLGVRQGVLLKKDGESSYGMTLHGIRIYIAISMTSILGMHAWTQMSPNFTYWCLSALGFLLAGVAPLGLSLARDAGCPETAD